VEDKNGKLIFEGDILRADYDRKTFTLAVRFGEHNRIESVDGLNAGDVGFYAEVMGESEKFARNDTLFWTRCAFAEVAGNIYENPELLGGADNV
jgi:uncharacterized phage protein (TIGR01671 family)